MDNYGFESEVIELLSYLKPSVKTGRRNADFATLPTNGAEQIAARHLQSSQRRSHTKPVNSSSRILNSERQAEQISKHHSLVRCTKYLYNQNQLPYQYSKPQTEKDKQLIKVIITPKLDNLLRKQKTVTKTIQNTSSNHESSIRTKNLYLVVTGRNKEKLYEIKTASSAKFTKEYIEHDDVEEFYNSEQFIKHWNMERKRKKDKKKNDICKKKEAHLNMSEEMPEHVTEVGALNDEIKCVGSEKSRVRIFGRIGLTEDDKYVFKCHATVDDKLVSTTTTENMISGFLVSSNNGLADSITQTDDHNNVKYVEQRNLNHKNGNRRDTQSTQVNFNDKSNFCQVTSKPCFVANEQVLEEGVECDCKNYPIINTEYNSNNIKGCQNPLVVISVFPKQDSKVETINTTQYTQMITHTPIKDQNNKSIESFNKLTKNKTTRSRSPSPKGLNAKEKTNTKSSPTKSNINNQNSIGFRKANKRGQQNKNNSKLEHTLQFCNPNENKDVEMKKQKNKSPCTKSQTNLSRRSRSKSPTVHPKSSRNKSPISVRNTSTTKSIATTRAKFPITHETDIQRNFTTRTFKAKSKTREGQLDKEINNQHLKAKKAPKAPYTKKLGKLINSKDKSTGKGTSKVSVNIDNKNEVYDVVICQDRFITDLNVRKTIKEVNDFDEKQKHSLTEKKTSSGSKKNRPRSLSQAISNIHNNDDLVTISPKLTPRDSLEISHRREGKFIKNTQTHRNSVQCTEDMKYFAPIKHYTGDECTICDPVKRDREIRKLLGVRGRTVNDQSQVSEAGDGPQEFYHKQCDGAFVAGLAVKDLTPFARLNETTLTVKNKNCDHIVTKDNQDNNGQKDCITFEANDKQRIFKLNYKDKVKIDTEQSNHCMVVSSTQWQKIIPERKPFDQQLTFNRNFQVFHLFEQLEKRKTILLSRKQYKKVIRTIHKSPSSKRLCNRSFVSIGRVREKPKRDNLTQHKKEHAASSKVALKQNYKETTMPIKKEPVETVVLFLNNARVRDDDRNLTKDPERHTASKVELRYSSVSRHVAFSTTNIESAGTSNFVHRQLNSIETIFRGHKKSPTPNLGTSGCSLSETTTSKTFSQNTKSGKPFLKRLISCLVMRSARSPLKQIETNQSMTANNSIDSYHISTSLGAITMTSSIYDTTASFYSDHSIHPLSSKLKRGFLSSIRDFLVSKKI